MATLATVAELQKMTIPELLKEIRGQQALVRKMRMEITLRKEKDSAKYRNERKQLARMETALTMVRAGAPAVQKTAKPAPKKKVSAKKASTTNKAAKASKIAPAKKASASAK